MWGEDRGPLPPKIRDVSLLADERVVEMLSERGVLVKNPQHKGPLLALTDRRLLFFGERDGQKETTIVPLEQIQGVTVRTSRRSLKPLTQGLALMVTALVAYLLIGTFIVEGVLIPAVVGTTIGVIGIYMVLRYVFWEDEASLTFRVDGWSFSFLHRVRQHTDAPTFVARLFELRSTVQRVTVDEAATRTVAQAPSPATAPLLEGQGSPSPGHRGVEIPPHESPVTPGDTAKGTDTPVDSDDQRRTDTSSRPGAEGDEREDLAHPGIGDDVQA